MYFHTKEKIHKKCEAIQWMKHNSYQNHQIKINRNVFHTKENIHKNCEAILLMKHNS